MSVSAGRQRLAVICTHPIQYYAPWFRLVAADGDMDVRVFYLLQPAVDGIEDPYFGRRIAWDIPLLEGYECEFVDNVARNPGVGRFWGFRNPQLAARVASFRPTAVLLVGYNFWSLVRFIVTWPTRKAPLLLRGDSHRLVPSTSAAASVKRALITLLFKRFAAFLYVGEANRRYFIFHGAAEGQLFHAPHAVDNERFQSAAASGAHQALAWRRSLGVPDGHTLLLFAGKLEDKKRPQDLLRSFLELRSADSSLVFVGDGPLESELRSLAAGHSHVHLVPFQNQTMMPIVYAASQLLVLPSYGPFETWGLAVNEAMAVGRPAIVSSHVGCAEDLVIEGVTGLVYEAGNRDALGRALANALSDRARLAQWGEAARTRIAGYSYASAAEGLRRAINQVAHPAAS